MHVFVLIHLCILSANHMCACATKISSMSFYGDDFEEIGYDDQIWSGGRFRCDIQLILFLG